MSNLGKFHNHHQPPGMIGAQKMGILKIHKSAGSWMLASDWVHQAVSALHHHRAHQYLDFVFKGQGVVRYVKWPKETAQVFFIVCHKWNANMLVWDDRAEIHHAHPCTDIATSQRCHDKWWLVRGFMLKITFLNCTKGQIWPKDVHMDLELSALYTCVVFQVSIAGKLLMGAAMDSKFQAPSKMVGSWWLS